MAAAIAVEIIRANISKPIFKNPENYIISTSYNTILKILSFYFLSIKVPQSLQKNLH